MGGGTGAEASGVQGFPLTARAKYEEDSLHTYTVGRAWSPTAETMGVLMFWEQQSDDVPQIVWDMPLIHDGHIHKNSVLHESPSFAAVQK